MFIPIQILKYRCNGAKQKQTTSETQYLIIRLHGESESVRKISRNIEEHFEQHFLFCIIFTLY